MFFDSASLDIMVRSVALSAFVETPRDAVIIAEQDSGWPRLAAARDRLRDGLNGGLRIFRRGLTMAGGRLGRLVEAGRPDDRSNDPYPA